LSTLCSCGKKKPKNAGYFFHFQKSVQSKQSPDGRKSAQSGHPDRQHPSHWNKDGLKFKIGFEKSTTKENVGQPSDGTQSKSPSKPKPSAK
jgi:hypothetical protein